MQRYARTDRVSHLIHREIADIVEHEVKDERLGMVTITGVEVTRDFKYAKVFFSVLGDTSAVNGTTQALSAAANFIRARLNERIALRHIPALTFHYDASTEYGIRINTLLNELNHDES